MERRRTRSVRATLVSGCAVVLAVALLLCYVGVGGANQVKRDDFEFVIEGDIPSRDNPTLEASPPSQSAPSSGSGSSGDSSPPPASQSNPGPNPNPAPPANVPQSSPPQQQSTFTLQPFVPRYNFDDRRSDAPIDSPLGQFLSKNVYSGGPNFSVLNSGISSSLMSSTPSFTLVTNTPSQTALVNIVKTITNIILNVLSGPKP